MKTLNNTYNNKCRNQVRSFFILMITGSILTMILSITVQAQNLAMMTSNEKVAVKIIENVKSNNFKLGSEALEINNEKVAIGFFTAAISENSNDAEAYHKRGIAYGRIHQWKNAIKDFNSAISHDSINADFYFHRGLAFNKIDKHKEAVIDCNHAIAINGSLTEAFLVRGISKAIMDDGDGSMSDFRKAVSLKPDYAEAYYNIGLNYYEDNDDINAKIMLNKAKSLGFENPELATYLKK